MEAEAECCLEFEMKWARQDSLMPLPLQLRRRCQPV